MEITQDIKNKVKALPKVELHRHLEGCISPELLLKVAKEYDADLPTTNLQELRSLILVKDKAVSLREFLDKFYVLVGAFPTLEAVEHIAYSVCRDCAQDNIRVVELRFSPTFMSLKVHYDWDELLQMVLQGARRAAADFSIEVGLIVGISRSNSLKQALRTIEIASRYTGLGVVGVDLFGEEGPYPPEIFVTVFEIAQESGLNITIHAGEGGGETNIKAAIEQLGAQRIGHGIKIINDIKMMTWVRERGIPLEISLTSNVKTKTVPSLKEHPVRKLYDFGIKMSLNTDDPAICDTTLSREYLMAMEYFDFDLEQIKKMILDSLDQSFLESYRKNILRPKLERELAEV